MTLLDYIKSQDKAGKIIFSDEYNANNGFYIDVNKLSMLEDRGEIFGIVYSIIEDDSEEDFYNSFCLDDDIRFIDEPAFEFMNKTNIIIDKEVKGYKSNTRRPYFRMRGKRVTEQQAFEIISKVDRFFSWELHLKGAIDLLHFPNWWFSRNHYPTHYGWCHPSGIIGYNAITDKYPTIFELISDMIEIKCAFPYLDFVIAITNWDEVPPEEEPWRREFNGIKKIEKHLKAAGQLSYKEYTCFLKNITIGIWVHDNTIEFMKPSRARAKYNEYQKQYGEKNSDIYIPKYYQDHKIFTADRAYLERCIRTYGLNPYEVLSKVSAYIWQG